MIGEKVNPEEHANWGAVPSEQVPKDCDSSGAQESGAEAIEKAEGSPSSGKSKRKKNKAEIEGASSGYPGRRPTNNGILKNKKLN